MRRSIRVRQKGRRAVWTDDGDTLNIADFIQWAFNNHNVYLDFDIDFTTDKLVCRIIKNTAAAWVIKDNIKLSTPTFDKNELPNYNKAMVYNKETGAILGTYYLLANNTVTTSAGDTARLLPVQTKYIGFDADKGQLDLVVQAKHEQAAKDLRAALEKVVDALLNSSIQFLTDWGEQ